MVKRIFYSSYFILLIFVVWVLPVEARSYAIINLVPLQTIRLFIVAFLYDYAPLHIVIGNIIGNIVLTIPIGILIVKYLRDLGVMTLLFLSIYVPVYIEAVQFLLHLIGYATRTIDIDDVLLNMFGIWIGYLISEIFHYNQR